MRAIPNTLPPTTVHAHGNTGLHPSYTPTCSHRVCEHPRWTPSNLLTLTAHPEQPLYSLPTEQGLLSQMEETYPGSSDGDLLAKLQVAHGLLLGCVVDQDAPRLREIGAFIHAQIRWLAARMDPQLDRTLPVVYPSVYHALPEVYPSVYHTKDVQQACPTGVQIQDGVAFEHTAIVGDLAAQLAEQGNQELAARVQAMLDVSGHGRPRAEVEASEASEEARQG
ncbi:hypothetical protein P7C70_g8211, partial [Phenoliferia sp. Uapishka_3]